MNTRDLHIPSNKVRDIVRYMHTELDAAYSAGEVRTFARLLAEAFLGWDSVQLLMHNNDTINQSDLLKFHWAVEDLKHFRPIQHITGYTDFCGLRIEVSPSVLIPRPETEEIVSLVMKECPSPSAVADLCTGSGCIALAVAHAYPQARVIGVDVSETALSVARRNSEQNRVPVEFVRQDILEAGTELPSGTFDLIVSNPPYVCEKEREQMEHNVLDYEPALALFVPDDDPLKFYHAIARKAAHSLAPDGLLAFEINEHYGEEVCQLLRREGFSPQLHTDFRGKDRCVTARKNTHPLQ